MWQRREGGQLSTLKIEDIVHQRGSDGKLLPIEVELEILREYETVDGEDGKKKQVVKTPGPTVKITPMTRGEIKELFQDVKKAKKDGKEFETSKDQDAEIIKSHLIEPQVPEDKIADMKPKFAGAITTAIMAISLEQPQSTMQAAGKAAIKKFVDELDEDIAKK